MWHAAYLVKQAIGRVPDTSASLAQFGRWRGGATTRPLATAPAKATTTMPEGVNPWLKALLVGGTAAGAYALGSHFGGGPLGRSMYPEGKHTLPKSPADDMATQALEERQGLSKAISPGTAQ